MTDFILVEVPETQIVQVVAEGPQGPQGQQGIEGPQAERSIVVPLYQPHLLQAVQAKPFVYYIDADQFPNGVTVREVRLSANASSTYSLGVLSMASPTDAGPTTVTTVATSSSTEASTTPGTGIAAGRYIGLSLPTTSISYILVQIWIEEQA